MNFSQKVANLKKFSRQLSELVSTYMSFILVLIFLVPWISGKIKLHNSDAVVTLVEVFVLSSATLSLLTFTYISGMSDLHEKIKKSMIVAGESFFVATVQFIVGLSLFLLVTLIINHFMDPSALTLNFIDPSEISMNLDLNGIVYVILFFIQLMGKW
ncbi:MAG: hypothetical protein K8E24_009490 [Methanobacterium paludis]|nr:hypothetical protein [Methanobacterium paludis]